MRVGFGFSLTLTLPFMPLLLRRVRGNSAAGSGGRAPSFPRKRMGGAPGAYERQVRKNRTPSYMNGWTATANLRKRITLFFYVSYRVLTVFLRMNVILTYFATETDTATDTWRWKQGIRQKQRIATALYRISSKVRKLRRERERSLSTAVFTAGQTMTEPEVFRYWRIISSDGASRSRIAADTLFNAHFQ